MNKDVYEYLTNFADDRTILNMLSVNKTFSDDKFFERVMERKYPLLMEFKKTTWKDLFIRKTYYIAKLEENFGIPYIPTKGYDPENFYKDLKNDYFIYEYAMKEAAKGGNLDIVKKMERKGAKNFRAAMAGAAEGGQMGLVKYFIKKKNVKNFVSAMNSAASGGQLEMVKFMIEQGADDFSETLDNAVEGGNLEVVKLVIEKAGNEYGREDFNEALSIARKLDIVKFLKKKLT